MIIVCIILMVFIFLGFLAGRWLKRIPTAQAWDPNSHDKMTLFALNLLAQEETKTLLGWVIHLSRQDPVGQYFQHCIESQVRRGSVEEDMNSYLLTRHTYTVLGKDTLEGANGGYHFFNPKRAEGPGLTDPTFFLTLLGRAASGCVSPMPSAVERAFLSSVSTLIDGGWEGWLRDKFWRSPTTNWHLDNEYRNYSVGNAMAYYRNGYSHLGFYAIGRVAHLLQDMAVPAHVRDDAHPGGAVEAAGFDPSDPMEQYADMQDKPVSESEYHLHKWSFDPERVYDSSQSPVFAVGQGIWLNNRKTFTAPSPELFHHLSNTTHENHYSYNTIPGNANSHDPNQTAVRPLPRTGPVDWEKCCPSSDGLAEIFRHLLTEAQTICLEFAKDIKNLANPSDWDRPMADKYQAIMARIPALSDPFKSIKPRTGPYQSIVGLAPHYHFPSEVLPPLIAGLNGLYPEIKSIGPELGSTAHQLAQSFVRRYELLNLPGLLTACQDAICRRPPIADRDYCTEDIIRHWIESFPDPQVLSTVFDVRVKPWSSLFQEIKNNGPCCLDEDLIRDQWLRTQPYGLGFTAILLATWFARQFEPGGDPGLVTWQSKDAGDAQTKPDLEPLPDTVNCQALSADKAATIGVAHRLPLAMDLDVEITLLEEGSDPEVWEEGVELEITWGRRRSERFIKLLGFDTPENMFYTGPGTAGGTVDPGIGHEWFKRDHYNAQKLRSYVMLDGREGLTWLVQNLGRPVLQGKAGHENSATSLTVNPPAADPYNLENLLRLPLPRGIWSQPYTEMGGLASDQEANPEWFSPLELMSNDSAARDRICAAFLRLAPRTPSPAPTLPGPRQGGA